VIYSNDCVGETTLQVLLAERRPCSGESERAIEELTPSGMSRVTRLSQYGSRLTATVTRWVLSACERKTAVFITLAAAISFGIVVHGSITTV
jgi:hypothetical protein